MTNQFLCTVEGYTRRNYAHGLREFAKWYRANIGPIDWKLVTRDNIRLYLRNLWALELSRGTIKCRMIALKAFFKWAVRMRLVDRTPATISIPKQDQRLPIFLTTDQAGRLMGAPLKMAQTPDAYRDAAILETFYSTGCRISELCAIDADDIDLESGIVVLKGKGHVERQSFLTGGALGAIKAYWARLGSRPDAAAFLSNGSRIYPRLIQMNLKRYLAHAKLDSRLSPHKIRHSFATHMLDAGCDLRSLQELMGHNRITSTEIYTHVSVRRLKAAYDLAHPRA